MRRADRAQLAAVLARTSPFDALDDEDRAELAEAATIEQYAAGDVVLDAFADPSNDVLLVLVGRVGLWHDPDALSETPDETLGPGGLLGYSAMLTRTSIGPRAVATLVAEIARIPGATVAPAFASPRGARFLAASTRPRVRTSPSYTTMADLVRGEPVVVAADATVREAAELMTQHGCSAVVVRVRDSVGLLTDAGVRRTLTAAGDQATLRAADAADVDPPRAFVDGSATEALIDLLDRDADHVLVVDRDGGLRGVVGVRDFLVSSVTAGVSLHEQLRRARTVEELLRRAQRMPDVLGDLLARGLGPARTLTVYSAMVDSLVRKAITLVMVEHDDLDADDFTWLSLGSNGRREAVLASDVDSAVAFRNGLAGGSRPAYARCFAQVNDLLSRAGLARDAHAATAQNPTFARTHEEWAAAARGWLAAPSKDEGAMMTSLLVDGRPIHGDPGLPEVSRVFAELREHPSTMRLLLSASLANRARLRDRRELLPRRHGTFDVKAHALLPIVNAARWAALTSGSFVLPTVERLRAGAGSAILPDQQAATMVEVFEVLQGLRLRWQLEQRRDGETPSDRIRLDLLSPIDRSVVHQAVREVAAVQRRMDNVASYVDIEEWTQPEP